MHGRLRAPGAHMSSTREARWDHELGRLEELDAVELDGVRRRALQRAEQLWPPQRQQQQPRWDRDAGTEEEEAALLITALTQFFTAENRAVPTYRGIETQARVFADYYQWGPPPDVTEALVGTVVAAAHLGWAPEADEVLRDMAHYLLDPPPELMIAEVLRLACEPDLQLQLAKRPVAESMCVLL